MFFFQEEKRKGNKRKIFAVFVIDFQLFLIDFVILVIATYFSLAKNKFIITFLKKK